MRRLSLAPCSPGSRPRSRAHLVRRLPRAADHLADAAHRLAVARHHADRAEIVQDVLGRDRLAADAALGERDVLGDVLVEVMADHQHVEVLVERVDRVGPRRIRRAGQHVRLAAHADDVGRVAAAGALGVIRVNRAALERRDRIVHVARLVQRVGVNRHLDVVAFGDASGSSRSPPASCPSPRAASGRSRRRGSARRGLRAATCCPCRVNPKFIGSASVACSISADVPRARRAGRRVGAGRRPGAAADERRHAARERRRAICCGQMKWMCVSMPPAVRIRPSPAIASVVTPTTMPGVTPAITSGLPALPMPAMRPCLMPMSAL